MAATSAGCGDAATPDAATPDAAAPDAAAPDVDTRDVHAATSVPTSDRVAPDAATPSTDSSDASDASGAGEPPAVSIGAPITVADEPVDAHVRPGTDDVWIAERSGRLVTVEVDGAVRVVLDRTDHVEPAIEEGLLGISFSPSGDEVYLNKATGGETVVTAYPIHESGLVDEAARRELLRFDQPYEAHNGGDLLIAPDGTLLVFSGDGGFIGDPERVALDPSSPLGKILRIDPTDGAAPADNPFVDDEDALDTVWSVGLRNPWRASIDPTTGDLWIGDVGDFGWEEVNLARARDGLGRGASFGWSAYEGPDRFNEDQPGDGHQPPWYAYRHGDGGRCSITGGLRYRGDALPGLDGWYVFADFCDATVRAIEVTESMTPGREIAIGTVEVPVSIRPGPGGGLLVTSIAGEVVPVVPAPGPDHLGSAP